MQHSIYILVFYIVTSRSLWVVTDVSKVPTHSQCPEDEGSRLLRNVNSHLRGYTLQK
jgi:hypothetical protein